MLAYIPAPAGSVMGYACAPYFIVVDHFVIAGGLPSGYVKIAIENGHL